MKVISVLVSCSTLECYYSVVELTPPHPLGRFAVTWSSVPYQTNDDFPHPSMPQSENGFVVFNTIPEAREEWLDLAEVVGKSDPDGGAAMLTALDQEWK